MVRKHGKEWLEQETETSHLQLHAQRRAVSKQFKIPKSEISSETPNNLLTLALVSKNQVTYFQHIVPCLQHIFSSHKRGIKAYWENTGQKQD